MAALKENTNVSQVNDQEESDHLEDVENGENIPNENNSEVKAKKKKKKNKKKPAAVSADVNGQTDHSQVVIESVKNKEEAGDEDKDSEDVAEGNICISWIAYILNKLNMSSFSGDGKAAVKKKKKNRSKKKTPASSAATATAVAKGQTEPPTIPIVALFPDGSTNFITFLMWTSLRQILSTIIGNFPVGEEVEYPVGADDRTAKGRFTSEEKKALDRSQMDIYNEVRCAAEAHRQVIKNIV